MNILRTIKKNTPLRKDGLNFQRRRRRFQKEKAKKIAIFILEILLVNLLAYGTVRSFGIRMTIAGESMEPTLSSGDVVLLNKIGSIDTNDIVVFQPSSNLSAQYSVKRVIGTPGDTIVISNGDVYVNDVLFHNIAETEDIEDAGLASTEITLGEDEYFLLGDNRNNSEDSRYETIGNISSEAVVGKVWFCLSLGHFGLVNY
ncbi:MAG: signal peptidase I [Lachnospiraceae bacterium]|nr:signal peptidase I [Lachnospiraceae bacterium]